MRRSALLIIVIAAMALGSTPAAAQPRLVSIVLVQGWNNIGYIGDTRPVMSGLAALGDAYDSVWTWDGESQRWQGMTPLAPTAGDLRELRHNQAYWIQMTARAELVMETPAAPAPVTLTGGWNNFVYPGNEQPVSDVLAQATSRFDSVWRWDAPRQAWDGFTPAAPAASDFSAFSPNRTYFLRLESGPPLVVTPAPVTFAQPTVPPSPVAMSSPVAGVPTPPPGAAGAFPTATPSPVATAGRSSRCRSFQSYQPQVAEVGRALNRAGHGVLIPDLEFAIKELETRPDGNGGPVAPYVPPTILKAVGWVESGWRQATVATSRGTLGPVIASTSCAYGLMQILSGMDVGDNPSPKQQRIAVEYAANIAAGAQMMGTKWNLAPDHLPVVIPRNPRALEDWYYAVWAYHCFGELCQALSIHNNPDDPALKWPRPSYNSPDQIASSTSFGFGDYPYQELVYGLIANPPRVNNAPVWQPLPVMLPPRGAVGFPAPRPFLEPAGTLDPTGADG